ncbi:MAG: hypothetical protein LBQ84_09145 [Flavobacteriaceae bacterium]|jgi:hypothetical protein|nr:hypothetical protein [Flavobacteriaceae bacterium]
MFKIKDVNFEIVHSYLDAFISNQENKLIFGLHITGKSKKDVFLEYEPTVHSDVLLKINVNEIKKWNNISNKIIEWENYPEDETAPPSALLYVFEHEFIYNCKIKFKEINGEMFININALCDVNFDEEYSRRLPLEIETKIEFEGIYFGKGTNEKECIERIKQYLPEEKLIYVKNKYDVSLLIPNNRNVESNRLIMGY